MSRTDMRRRKKNFGFRKDDIVHAKDGRVGRIVKFERVPNGRRVAFVTANPDKGALKPECFTIPVDELRMANALDRLAWEV